MWLADIEHFPLGNKEVRKLLLLRGFGGFLGGRIINLSRCNLELANDVLVWGLYCMIGNAQAHMVKD